MSCVAEATAMSKHKPAAIAKFAFKSSPAKSRVPINIKLWQNKIQLRRCPNHLYNNGSLVLSISGDHIKLMLYAPNTIPNKPIILRLRPSSFSQADITEPISTHGKPLLIPNIKILIKRLSLKYEKYSLTERVLLIGPSLALGAT